MCTIYLFLDAMYIAKIFCATIQHAPLVKICDAKVCKSTTRLAVDKVGTSKLHIARRMPGIKYIKANENVAQAINSGAILSFVDREW